MAVQGPGKGEGANRPLTPELNMNKQDTLKAIHGNGLTKAMGEFKGLEGPIANAFNDTHKVTSEPSDSKTAGIFQRSVLGG